MILRSSTRKKREAEEVPGRVEVHALNKNLKHHKPQERTQSVLSKLLQREIHYWNLGHEFVVGVDEAGRGPLAGPVVVAACAIDKDWVHEHSQLINDSKTLSEDVRETLFDILTSSQQVHFEIAIISPLEIDEMNILQATLFGMDQVISRLTQRQQCDVVLIDGPHAPKLALKEQSYLETIKGGDGKVRAIGAASVLAKVTRDRLMLEYHKEFPEYGFDRHKGYPVKAHVKILKELGPCPLHRRSYAPVRLALEMRQESEEQ